MGKFFIWEETGAGRGTRAAKRRVKKQKAIKRYASHGLGVVQGYLTASSCAWSLEPQ